MFSSGLSGRIVLYTGLGERVLCAVFVSMILPVLCAACRFLLSVEGHIVAGCVSVASDR